MDCDHNISKNICFANGSKKKQEKKNKFSLLTNKSIQIMML